MKETKVYILDKLPNDCYECPNSNLIGNTCSISDNIYLDSVLATIGRHNDCPLIDIKDHDRELVAKVCEKIKEHLSEQKKSLKDTFSPYSNGKAFIISAVEDNLNKIEKEFEK